MACTALRACNELKAGLAQGWAPHPALLFPVLFLSISLAPSESGVSFFNLLIFFPLIALKRVHGTECGVTPWQRRSFHASLPHRRPASREACHVGWGGGGRCHFEQNQLSYISTQLSPWSGCDGQRDIICEAFPKELGPPALSPSRPGLSQGGRRRQQGALWPCHLSCVTLGM